MYQTTHVSNELRDVSIEGNLLAKNADDLQVDSMYHEAELIFKKEKIAKEIGDTESL